MGLIKALFGTSSSREIKRLLPLLTATENLESQFSSMSEDDLRAQTGRLREKLANGASLDDLLPEAFATVREAAWRVLGMKHFHVQLIGGVVLHQGRIAEMKTGEGKTLVATLPVYLNALDGKGVHVVTVNDYLATRDSEWMGKVYRYLGMDVGLIVHGLNSNERRSAYNADITYGTNNEFGFDYLRDNMVTRYEQLVQRPLHYAIVDEVDSILIDEARTPLIISGAGGSSSEYYDQAQRFVSGLKVRVFKETDDKLDFQTTEEMEGDADYIIDEKAKTAVLTKQGVKKAEQFFHVENLADQENYEINHHINNALRANGIMHRDEDYVMRGDEVVIVDDFTGRLMEGRRYSNGLHQAIEAKEGVHVQEESKTLATITFQNYFRMYDKLSGMTGTAMTEEDEFREIYHLDVVEIPPNLPLIRRDQEDAVYKTAKGKYQAVLEEVRAAHAKGEPVLIGTVAVDRSEYLSQLFSRAGLPHNVLNAKQHAREAEIVAQAGRYGAITVATNMAGRGTDIMLGGNPEFLAKQDLRKQGVLEELIEQADAHNETSDPQVLEVRRKFQELESAYKKDTDAEKQRVLAAGGLYIIGTERHESRRIDNQLRGRSGRQGDPGRSKFFLSLEDDLLRLFGGETMEKIFRSLGVDESMEIHHPLLSKGIESAQKRVEGQNFSIRKSVLQYDDVMNQQRELIYAQRRAVLEGKDVHDFFLRTLGNRVRSVLLDFVAGEPDSRKWDHTAMYARLRDLLGDLPVLETLRHPFTEIVDGEAFSEKISVAAQQALEGRAVDFGGEAAFKEAERMILLSVVDQHWMDHIDQMDSLRDSIGMRAYGQQDPVIAYKEEGFDLFEAMNEAIQEDALRLLMRARVVDPEKARSHGPRSIQEGRKNTAGSLARRRLAAAAAGQPSASGLAEPAQNAGGKAQPVHRAQRPGRNDPCWCGSGKKYKNCHMKADEAAERGEN